MGSHRTTFFVQLEPEWGHCWSGEDAPVRNVKAVNITQKRPTKPKAGSVTVKLTVEVPDAAFLPLRPEAVIVIPTDLTEPTPVEVVAEDPHAADDD